LKQILFSPINVIVILGNPNTTGEYVWESSESLRNLRKSILLMKECMLAAQGNTGANETLVQQVKDHLSKAEKVYYICFILSKS